MTKKIRIKSDALLITFSTLDEVDAAVAEIGKAQREREQLQTEMNNKIADIKEAYETKAAGPAKVIEELHAGIQAYAETHRVELTNNGRKKTVTLGSGDLQWRNRPPRVIVRNERRILDDLAARGLTELIRTKTEIDKPAILNNPAAVDGIKGLQIAAGEDFVVKPFSTALEEVRHDK